MTHQSSQISRQKLTVNISNTTNKQHFSNHCSTTHRLDRQSGFWQTEALEEPEEKMSKIHSTCCY